MEKTMKAAYLPGNSTVVMKEVPVPEPGHGQVLVKTKSSTICGSDIRAIYREHLGKGPEGYQNKIAGHEPAGQIVKCGPGMRRFKEGDRVVVYHISGCGLCNDCRRGYMISCTSPLRAAYGWQRDGGMAPYILAEERDLVLLPDSLTYTDGAQVACGFGTVYEGLEKIGISGNDAVPRGARDTHAGEGDGRPETHGRGRDRRALPDRAGKEACRPCFRLRAGHA
jgi:D-arabinose 1-dehydrogenase-like Zn-dependent alcohol dehydrogenase